MDEQSNVSQSPRGIRSELHRALGAFSELERLAFLGALILSIIAVVLMLGRINEHFLVGVPAKGGTLSEGVVGTPRFVNPLLAATDADRDLTALVYRGLMKVDGNGDLVTDLADSYTISKDGLTYTFILKDAAFQDGEAVTADDVVFTIKSAQDATLKSAARVAWEGVQVKAEDAKTVTFTLKQAYAPFLENTTLGILPKHIWSKVSYDAWAYSDFNTKGAIGAGAYKVKTVTQSSLGVPDSYELTAVRTKNGPNPLIDTIKLHFYANEDTLISAYNSGDIDTLGGIDPENAKILQKDGARIITAPLPRIFGLFFNQSQAKIFADSKVRQAIDIAINKDRIVAEVLDGYGESDTGPIPGGSKLTQDSGATEPSVGDSAQAKKILEADGWKLGADGIYTKVISKKETDRLSFEIATNDTPELTHAVDLISKDLLEVGIEASPKVYETGSLNQDIIRPRKFEALFFGEVISNASDLYAFWHSSQRNDPGLNISRYTNSKVDNLLEQGLATTDEDKVNTIYSAFEKEIASDVPAVFVYSPSYIYAVRPGLPGITVSHITTPEDRFANINTWYLATDRVWKIFAKN